MSEQNPINGYTAADIRRYLTGEMTNAEMRQLEMSALEDPFLQDAIDGYEENLSQNPDLNLQPWLNQIRKLPESEEKKEKAAIIPLWRKKWLQYAVAATLIVGAGWTIFNLSQQNDTIVRDQSSAKVKKTDSITERESPTTTFTDESKNAANESSPSANYTIIPKGQTNKPEVAINPGVVQKQTNNEPILETESKAQTAPVIAKDEIAQLSQKAEEPAKAKKEDDEAAPKARSAAKLQAPPATVSAATSTDQLLKKDVQDSESTMVRNRLMMEEKSKVANNSISGLILNEEKYPLDNIKLKLTGKINEEILSDELGRFYFTLPENAEGLLTITGSGYKTKEVKVKAGENLEIILQKGEKSLSEMIVAEYSKKGLGNTEQAKVDTSEAVPVGGWNNFEAYLNKNKKQIDKSAIVVLSFEVDEKGRPELIEVIQSGGLVVDADAIRLIKNGPNWRNKTASPGALVRVIVKY